MHIIMPINADFVRCTALNDNMKINQPIYVD